MRIGLTGGIASGKTMVSSRLAELGAAVLDADAFARIAVEKGSEGLKEIVKAFGGGMLDSDGCLDRRKLGAAVFGDEAARLRLNGILHPAVRAGMLRAAEAAEESGFRVIVFDVPLLIECGWQEIADEVWLVTAPMEERVRRIKARDGLSEAEAKKRIASQMSDDEKKPFADVIIDNSGDIERLYEMTDRLYRQALEKDGSNQRQTGGAEKKPSQKEKA